MLQKHIGYWISPSLSDRKSNLVSILSRVAKQMQESKKQGKENIIHVGTVKEVKAAYGQKLTYISDKVVNDIYEYNIDNIEFLQKGSQLISLCLFDLNVSSTGFSDKDNILIANNVVHLGGKYKRSFTDSTNLVVASSTLSETYYSAKQKGIKIVTIDWIKDSYKNIEKMPFNNSYNVPCFYNMVFTTTDISHNVKKDLKKMISENGGKIQGQMDDSTTFLISETLCMTPKIELALSTKTLIIKPEWIKDCIASTSKIDNYVLNWWHIIGYTTNLLFDKNTFLLQGETSSDILIEAIQANGGSIVKNEPGTYVVLPLTGKRNQMNYVTPWWIWQCLSQRKMININSSISYSPIGIKLPINQMLGKIVYVHESLNKEERIEVVHLLREAGAKIYFNFSLVIDYIVSHDVDDVFAEKSKKYSMPIVKIEWVYQLIKTGKIPNPSLYATNHNDKKLLLKDICGKIIGATKNTSDFDSYRNTNNEMAEKQVKVVNLSSVEFTQQQKSDSEDSSQHITYDSTIDFAELKRSKSKSSSKHQKKITILSSSSDDENGFNFSKTSSSDSDSEDPLMKLLAN